jgi:hypothetical protein
MEGGKWHVDKSGLKVIGRNYSLGRKCLSAFGISSGGVLSELQRGSCAKPRRATMDHWRFMTGRQSIIASEPSDLAGVGKG